MPGQDQAIRLFVGGHAGTLPRPLADGRIVRERDDLGGDRCFSAAHPANYSRRKPADGLRILLDSGAFTDVTRPRLSLPAALGRQLAWEVAASTQWGFPVQAAYLSSYDRLIDEMDIPGQGKTKRRWSWPEAESAVAETIAAAAYLVEHRRALAPRTLVLGVQGVDSLQYTECCRAVLDLAQPGDWIGLGGWCILGKMQSWLPAFWATLDACLPLIAAAGLDHVHIYGVLWRPALGGLLAAADRYGLTVSTDSSGPILACTRKDFRTSGARFPYWRDNVAWWQRTCADLRASPFYRTPPALQHARQLSLFD